MSAFGHIMNRLGEAACLASVVLGLGVLCGATSESCVFYTTFAVAVIFFAVGRAARLLYKAPGRGDR